MACKKCPYCDQRSIYKFLKYRGTQHNFFVGCGNIFSFPRLSKILRSMCITGAPSKIFPPSIDIPEHRSQSKFIATLRRYIPPLLRKVTPVMDATFFGKRDQGFNLTVVNECS